MRGFWCQPSSLGWLVVSLSVLLVDCTTYNPRTGEQELDAGATAGLVGLILGATALAVAAEHHDHDDRHHDRYDRADRRDDHRHRHHARDDRHRDWR